ARAGALPRGADGGALYATAPPVRRRPQGRALVSEEEEEEEENIEKEWQRGRRGGTRALATRPCPGPGPRRSLASALDPRGGARGATTRGGPAQIREVRPELREITGMQLLRLRLAPGHLWPGHCLCSDENGRAETTRRLQQP
ncbi:unnamed protein product, partial [Prorocentrum cordatum]